MSISIIKNTFRTLHLDEKLSLGYLFGMGKMLFYIGLGIAFLGLCIWMGNKIGLPFGKLPGDIQYRSGNTSIYLPIATCIVVSLILTIGFNILSWILSKWN